MTHICEIVAAFHVIAFMNPHRIKPSMGEESVNLSVLHFENYVVAKNRPEVAGLLQVEEQPILEDHCRIPQEMQSFPFGPSVVGGDHHSIERRIDWFAPTIAILEPDPEQGIGNDWGTKEFPALLISLDSHKVICESLAELIAPMARYLFCWCIRSHPFPAQWEIHNDWFWLCFHNV